MIAALVAIAAIAVILAGGMVLIVLRILNAQSAERARFAQERWELLTRLQTPQVYVPPPEQQTADEDEGLVDESHLVGMIA